MTAKKPTPPPKEETPKPERKGLFSKFAAVDDATGSDLLNFDLAMGDNKCRVIDAPILVRKHWDLPSSSDLKGAVPCAKWIEDPTEYAAAAEAGVDELQNYLDSLADCPYCELHAQYPDFYKVKDHWVFNVVQDGQPKIAEFYQASILREINKFENDEDWTEMMPNGLWDLEIKITKTQTGPKPQNVKYAVSGVPTSKPLSDEQLAAYREKAVDLVKLKSPPDSTTDEGKAKWAELLSKAKAPKCDAEGNPVEKPKGFGN